MKTQDVKLYAAQQLHRLQALPDNQRRAELAKLRRGIGHAPGELPELWGCFLLGMPESFQGRSGSLGGRVGGLPCPDPVCCASAGE